MPILEKKEISQKLNSFVERIVNIRDSKLYYSRFDFDPQQRKALCVDPEKVEKYVTYDNSVELTSDRNQLLCSRLNNNETWQIIENLARYELGGKSPSRLAS